MIKVYCDKCGKEITSGGSRVVETTDIVDCHGSVILKLNSGVSHICDECQYSCGFKVGDEVITDDGRVGRIVNICDCKSCRKRGFFEPEVKFDDGDTDYIEISDKNDGFKSFYKIGDQIFGNLDDSYLLSRRSALKEELQKVENRLTVINRLKTN